MQQAQQTAPSAVCPKAPKIRSKAWLHKERSLKERKNDHRNFYGIGSRSFVPVTPAFNQEDTSTWSSEQKQEWQDTGKSHRTAEKGRGPGSRRYAQRKKTATSEPKGKSAAESGAAIKQEKPGKATADDRIGELTGTIKRMEAELADLRKPERYRRTSQSH